MNDGERREMAVELSVPQAEEEEAVNKQSTTILEQVRQNILRNFQILQKLSFTVRFYFL